MAEKFTDIELKPIEQQPVSTRRQSFARQHVRHSLDRGSENVNAKDQSLVTAGAKNEDEGRSELKAPFTWRLLEDHKYSPYIKRLLRLIPVVNILSLAVNGPAIPTEYLTGIERNNLCEKRDEKKIHFIVLLVVDVILSILFTLLLLIRTQNSRYWHKLKKLKVFVWVHNLIIETVS